MAASKKYGLGVKAVCILLLFALSSPLHAQDVFLDEQFTSLDRWEPFYFKNIDNHSSYSVGTYDDTSCLIATSNNSASAMVLPERFNIYDFPDITWRWQVKNVYQKGDSSKKEGDDAPIRLYVMFEYDPEKSSFFKAIKYEVIRILYGEYPPHSSLNYFWASKQQSIPFIENPYSDLIMMVPVASGQGEVGEWLEHTVNVVEDYRAAFGEDPPPIAGIAVMSDSDNTGESAKAYIDFIKIYKKIR